MPAPWKAKADRIVAELSYTAYKQANPLPQRYGWEKRKPYHVPAVAVELADCLATNDEHRAKAIFMCLLDVPELAIT